MTFLEAKENQIERLNIRLSELIEEQREKMQNILKTKTDLEFLFHSTISQIGQREENIIYIHNSIDKLKKFNILIVEDHKRLKTAEGKLTDRKRLTYVDLKTDGDWMKTTECTKEQMWSIYRGIYNKDKNLFFETLQEITKNKSLTHRYTKYFFGSSIKHK